MCHHVAAMDCLCDFEICFGDVGDCCWFACVVCMCVSVSVSVGKERSKLESWNMLTPWRYKSKEQRREKSNKMKLKAVNIN